jgi:hypothetical protein
MRGIINGQNVCFFRNGQPKLQHKKLQATHGTHAKNKDRPQLRMCFTLHSNECKVGKLKMELAETWKPLLPPYKSTRFRISEGHTLVITLVLFD